MKSFDMPVLRGAIILALIVFGSAWWAGGNPIAAAIIAVLMLPLIYFVERWSKQRRP